MILKHLINFSLIDEEAERLAARATKVGGMAYDPEDFNTYEDVSNMFLL